ncbi:hypothetical protein ACWC5G_05705, partial [Streptomyces sp. NPDC001274]
MQDETACSAIDTFISAFNASDDSYVTDLLSQALTSDVVGCSGAYRMPDPVPGPVARQDTRADAF